MKWLIRVRYGNDDRYKHGYDAIDIIGLNQIYSQPSIFLIHSDTHSEKKGLNTVTNKIFDRILDIIIF